MKSIIPKTIFTIKIKSEILISPSELSDQHLIAEYREIFMVGSALRRSLKSANWKNTRKNLPSSFTLNTGHVKFFYNKGKYLYNRYQKLIEEMKVRGMKPDPSRIFKKEQWPKDLYNDWEPSKSDMDLVRIRIKEKLSKKPEWYRWTKK